MATSLIPLRQKKRLVTYHVDTDTTYTAKYKKNANVLADLSFTPSKSGWTFVGWRQDTTASSSGALSYLRMGSEEITLYAVYKQTITLSYAGNGATSGSTSQQTGTRYYNAAGVYANPSFTLRSNGFTRVNYTFSKWALNSASGTKYSVGASVTLSASATFYAVWTLNSSVILYDSGTMYSTIGNGSLAWIYDGDEEGNAFDDGTVTFGSSYIQIIQTVAYGSGSISGALYTTGTIPSTYTKVTIEFTAYIQLDTEPPIYVYRGSSSANMGTLILTSSYATGSQTSAVTLSKTLSIGSGYSNSLGIYFNVYSGSGNYVRIKKITVS